MIIYGSRVREKVTATGQYNCPNCIAARSFKHKRIGNYFARFFIPLFKIKSLGEYIDCQECHPKNRPEMLTHMEPSLAINFLTSLKGELDSVL
jgi:hypothetical protein